MANYAIGDIQGCYDSLQALLKEIHFNADNDTLWILGDLVNRGPKSLSTVRFLKSLGSACQVILGNHDLHLIAIAQLDFKRKAKDTIGDILNASDRDDLISWLAQQSLARLVTINTQEYFMSHAGLPPIWSCQQALSYAQEVEGILSSQDANAFLAEMYGNTPASWNASLEGHDRLRIITNYFTRMRFCTQQGQLELLAKDKPNNNPEGFLPWFTFNNTHIKDEKILFGHWAALEGQTQQKHIYALDTGCVWGKKLSALRLEDEIRFSVPAQDSAHS